MKKQQSESFTTSAPDQATYWQAIQDRDKLFNGVFVYAVRSTGIYCRPSCPSRRPRFNQVLFFPLSSIAEQAGFRACRRCEPQNATLQSPQVRLVERVCRYTESNLEGVITLETLSAQVNINPQYLQRTFKRIVGISPRQYIDALRLGRLKKVLREGQSVTRALYEAGYSSSSRLYERASSQLGMTPSVYRRGGQDIKIFYTIIDCSLGLLLVGATDRGICSITLGDSEAALEAALLNEYPGAEIHRDDSDFREWVNAILSYLNGIERCLDLPLDIQATAFQRLVWEHLQAIPYGETSSYGEIAKALGRPSAARAVARACATNPLALLIPCHRVVREDGSLGGYRWGADRKRRLLAQEKENTELDTP